MDSRFWNILGRFWNSLRVKKICRINLFKFILKKLSHLKLKFSFIILSNRKVQFSDNSFRSINQNIRIITIIFNIYLLSNKSKFILKKNFIDFSLFYLIQICDAAFILVRWQHRRHILFSNRVLSILFRALQINNENTTRRGV